jgi:hypothetical protein
MSAAGPAVRPRDLLRVLKTCPALVQMRSGMHASWHSSDRSTSARDPIRWRISERAPPMAPWAARQVSSCRAEGRRSSRARFDLAVPDLYLILRL